MAVGERKTGAPFPFNVGESILNGLAVPFASHAATVEFDAPVDLHDDSDLYPKRSLKMTSRIEVAFGDGKTKMAGDLVTECALLHAVSRSDDSYLSIDESVVTGVNKESIEGRDDDAWFGDAPGRSKDAAEMDEFASWRMGGYSAVAEKFQRDEQDEESRSVQTPVSSPIVTREEIDDRRACLLTTRFERTGTVLDEVAVESGKIMGALMSPSPRLRRSFRGGGRPSVPYASVWCDGELMIAEGGSCGVPRGVRDRRRRTTRRERCARRDDSDTWTNARGESQSVVVSLKTRDRRARGPQSLVARDAPSADAREPPAV